MSHPDSNADFDLGAALADLERGRESFEPDLLPREIGVVVGVAAGIAKIAGLPNAGFEELLSFPGDLYGIVFNVDEHELGVVLLGDYSQLRPGDSVERTGRITDVPVGDALLGRVVDPLGRPLDGAGQLDTDIRSPIERPATPIMNRAPVSEPLQTGIKAIDALIPVGKGQRELIVGDRQTGKSAIAIDTILNQKDKDVLCIYCSIGQRASSVAKTVEMLRSHDALSYTVVVVADGSNAPGLVYVAPYAATSIAEFFVEAGRNVLIVYDDLTAHARAYREVSLLLRRPPGREAFPGDIFYIHSRLLERATHLSTALRGGSLTALPIVETEAQDLSAYIPTNLISITDGQIYLSPTLFELGQLPAIDVGQSVSRVGGNAQHPALHDLAGKLKLAYAQFNELEAFARFGARLDPSTRATIAHGERIRACLTQTQLDPLPVEAQILIFVALSDHLFDVVSLARMQEAQRSLREATVRLAEPLIRKLHSNQSLTSEDHAALSSLAKATLEPFLPTPPTTLP